MISMKNLVQQLKMHSKTKIDKDIKKEINEIDFFILESLIYTAQQTTKLLKTTFERIDELEKRIKELENKKDKDGS